MSTKTTKTTKTCPCGRKPAEFGASCVYLARLQRLAERASAHAGAETGEATCSCHEGPMTLARRVRAVRHYVATCPGAQWSEARKVLLANLGWEH